MKVIGIMSQKGGVGKSTTSVNFCYELNQKGYKTLLIDMDAQSNTSDTMRCEINNAPTIYEVINGSVDLVSAIQRTDCGDVIPACNQLRDLEDQARSEDISIYILKEKFEDLRNYYDYIVIDTPPNMGFALYSAMIACDEIIIPMIADRYSIQGLIELYQAVVFVRENYNADLTIAGILLTKHSDRMVFARQVREFLENYTKDMGTKLFERAIRETIKVRESQTVKRPLKLYDAYCTAAFDYKAVVEEYLGE